MRIGKKLVLSYTLLAVLIFVLAGFALRASIEYIYTEKLVQQLTTQVNTVNLLISEHGLSDFDSPETQAFISKVGKSMNARITIIRPDGSVVADTDKDPAEMENHSDRPEIRQALSGATGISKRFSKTTDREMLYVAESYEPGGKTTGVIRVSLHSTEITQMLNKLNLVMLAIMAVATALIIAMSRALSLSFTAPLKQMMDMAERMASDDLEQKLPIESRNEVGELSKALNNLAVKLKDRINELRSEKAKAELILHNMAEGILLLNKEGEVILTNPAIERIFKVRSIEIVGKPVIYSVRNYDLDHAIQESIASEREVIDEIELQAPYRKLRIRILPITNGAGEKQSLVVVRDITRQKQVERVRRDFIANISHELKTPLTGLKLLSDTLLRSIDTDPSSSRVFIKRLDKELSTLINMVRKLIDLSRIESPHDSMEKVPVDLGELVSEVTSSFSQLAASKGLSIIVGASKDVPEIMGDKDQLLTLIRNLVDNAVRYTPPGGRINIRLGSDGANVSLTVADNGLGLAKREIPRIFERFYRVDKARSRETGGTGLGLSIVKHVAENHGATIKVGSQLGIGSTFTIKFQIKP